MPQLHLKSLSSMTNFHLFFNKFQFPPLPWCPNYTSMIPETLGILNTHIPLSSCEFPISKEWQRLEGKAQESRRGWLGAVRDKADSLNTLRPRQNGRHFPDDIFKCIFLKENVIILIKISLKFVPYGPINNIPALVQIMAWRRPGDKPHIIWTKDG